MSDGPDLSVRLGLHTLASPLMAASGCAGFGHELKRWGGLNAFGALVTPSLSHEPREPSEEMRIVETPSAIVHPHDLPGVGTQSLSASHLPWEVCEPTPVVVSIWGETSGDFADAAADVRRRSASRGVMGLEANLSVPNASNNDRPFARDEYSATKVIARVREHLPRNVMLMAKLMLGSDLLDVARGVLKSGADAIVLGHPPAAVAIDPVTLRRTSVGAASVAGPALLPIMLGACFELTHHMRAGRLPTAPIIASGGVATVHDAVAALAAGASAVQVGSALFRNPRAGAQIHAGLAAYCQERNLGVADLIGRAHDN